MEGAAQLPLRKRMRGGSLLGSLRGGIRQPSLQRCRRRTGQPPVRSRGAEQCMLVRHQQSPPPAPTAARTWRGQPRRACSHQLPGSAHEPARYGPPATSAPTQCGPAPTTPAPAQPPGREQEPGRLLGCFVLFGCSFQRRLGELGCGDRASPRHARVVLERFPRSFFDYRGQHRAPSAIRFSAGT